MKKLSAVAVLDVGKTNKKVVLYDKDFRQVGLKKIGLDAVSAGDGIEHEQTAELLDWTCRTLAEFSSKFDIQAIGITTHGATLAVVDEDGELIHPVLSYMSPAGDRVEDEFNDRFGPPESIHEETCTSPFGFANAAKQIYFLQKFFPEEWKRAKHLLFYPQYLGFLLTGGVAVDPTFLSCHTYLWNPAKSEPSEIARALGVASMVSSPILSPWEEIGVVSESLAAEKGIPAGIPVTVGTHDSNSSLLPFLAKGFSKFTLNSTGTWCVAMTPSVDFHFEPSEIGTKTFYNLSPYGLPVKTSIFPGGLEFSEFSKVVGVTAMDDPAEMETACREKEVFLMGGIIPGAEAFLGSEPALHVGDRIWKLGELQKTGIESAGVSEDRFLAALNLSLAIQTVEVLNRAGRKDGSQIFVEGGFANNPEYCRALAALLPDDRICLTDLQEATAFGAALLAWKMVEGVELEDLSDRFEIDVKPVPGGDLPGLVEYARKYRTLSQR